MFTDTSDKVQANVECGIYKCMKRLCKVCKCALHFEEIISQQRVAKISQSQKIVTMLFY